MSDIIFTLAQFIIIIWPLFILTALVYSFQSTPGVKRSRSARRIGARLSSLGDHIRRNLLATWTFLFMVWLVTLFAPTNTPSLIPEPWNTTLFLAGFAVLLLLQAARLGLFRRRVLARIDLHRAQAIADLKRMDPYAFEALITETYRAYGFKVKHVGQSGDHGIDVDLYTPSGEHWIVQCKRYNDSVGESYIRDLYGAMTSDQADRGVMVTTAEITPPARAWARNKPIDLIDGHDLLDFIQGARDRTDGTWFDRLAHALYRLFASNPAAVPASPAAGAVTVPVSEETIYPNQPAAPVYSRRRIHYWRGIPVCPRCRLPMIPSPRRPSDRPGRTLYRCQNYPACRIVLEPEPVEPTRQPG